MFESQEEESQMKVAKNKTPYVRIQESVNNQMFIFLI